MNHHNKNGKPVLSPIKNGWAAHGDGWAVHAPTPEEAIQKFAKAEQRHKEIDQLPFWYERFNTHQITDADTNHSSILRG